MTVGPIATRHPRSAALARRFDATRMAAEVASLTAPGWAAQRSYGRDGPTAATSADWSILPLRSPGGDAQRTDPGGAGLVAFADTAWLRRCAYLREVLACMPAPLRAVRLMSLGPGTAIEEHRDGKCGLRYGLMRLHVPVVTNRGAVVVIDGAAQHWEHGRLWFGDFDRPHYVRNDGDEPRIHLVIDCLVTQDLLRLFPASFTGMLSASQILIAREPVALRPAELAEFKCRFAMPGSFADWAEDELEAAPADDVPAAFDIASGRLVLSVSGQPKFGLVHIGAGEFRFEGWSEERTLHLDPADPRPRIRFTVRRGRSRREADRPLRWEPQ